LVFVVVFNNLHRVKMTILQTFRGVFLVIVLFAGMALAARTQQLFPSHSIAQSSVLNQEEQDSDHEDSATVEPLEETQFSQHYEQTRLQLLQRFVAAADVGSNPSPKDTTEATTDSYTEGADYDETEFDTVPKGKYPFQAIVITSQAICSGTLITSRHILAPGSCIAGLSSSQISDSFVVLDNVSSDPVDTDIILRGVKNSWLHPKYRKSSTGLPVHDIAVLLLDEPVTNIVPVHLPSSAEVPENMSGFLASTIGFGTATNLLNASSVDKYRDLEIYRELQETKVNLISTFMCGRRYKEVLDGKVLKERRVYCTTRTTEDCLGDNGSPLLVLRAQIGMRVTGSGCFTDYPEIYTRVAYYKKWIDNITGNQSR